MRSFILSLLLWDQAFGLVEEFEKKCLAGDGLACAKAGYHFKKTDTLKAYEYYKKGCELKEESACFNMKTYDPNDVYSKEVGKALVPHSDKIRVCYVPQIKGKKFSNIQYKENFYKADFTFRIDQQGKASHINVKTVLDKKFVDCAKNIIAGISYPKPEGREHVHEFYMLFSAFE